MIDILSARARSWQTENALLGQVAEREKGEQSLPLSLLGLGLLGIVIKIAALLARRRIGVTVSGAVIDKHRIPGVAGLDGVTVLEHALAHADVLQGKFADCLCLFLGHCVISPQADIDRIAILVIAAEGAVMDDASLGIGPTVLNLDSPITHLIDRIALGILASDDALGVALGIEDRHASAILIYLCFQFVHRHKPRTELATNEASTFEVQTKPLLLGNKTITVTNCTSEMNINFHDKQYLKVEQ